MKNKWTENDLDNKLFEEINKNNPSETVLKELVHKGANINSYDYNGNSLLQNVIENIQEAIKIDENGHYADDEIEMVEIFENSYYSINLSLVKCLVELGVDVNIENAYESCLCNAIKCYSPELIEMLLIAGADPNWIGTELNVPVLNFANGDLYEFENWYCAGKDSKINICLNKIIDILIKYGAKGRKLK